ncbi:MAG: patatin [Gammaproteobacteria bacterium]|nr:patatin [Gammaproteobacteria bacterium]
MQKPSRKIGLILGSGSARGMCHIGVIRALEEIDIVPDIVVGCSVGALVGASYLHGKLEQMEKWALSLNKRTIASYFDLNFSFHGFVKKERMQEFYQEHVCGPHKLISQMDKPFAAVACDLSSGEEVWLKHGQVLDAIWASMSYPGLYPAYWHEERWLVDGGLVNPVPVSLAKSLGADVTIAVNLNADIATSHELNEHVEDTDHPVNVSNNVDDTFITKAKRNFRQVTSNWLSSDDDPDNGFEKPKVFDVIASSINIMQDRLTRSRLVGDPPDIVLAPRLSEIGLLELYKAKDAIAEGEACVKRLREEIDYRVNG